MLTTEPSLVEPEPLEHGYRIEVVLSTAPILVRTEPEDVVLSSELLFTEEIFETREAAIDFILDEMSLEIVE
ncbi:MAG: hypothetical protein QF577_09335, partial [Phycisphaerae bacterium]|nr:hypothetical protein [Phycisphaerae bacterium]